jgi:hypothetical protein
MVAHRIMYRHMALRAAVMAVMGFHGVPAIAEETQKLDVNAILDSVRNGTSSATSAAPANHGNTETPETPAVSAADHQRRGAETNGFSLATPFSRPLGGHTSANSGTGNNGMGANGSGNTGAGANGMGMGPNANGANGTANGTGINGYSADPAAQSKKGIPGANSMIGVQWKMGF